MIGKELSIAADGDRQQPADCVEKIDPAKWAMHLVVKTSFLYAAT
ncbi:hypothetical protein [Pseudomonas mohnii]